MVNEFSSRKMLIVIKPKNTKDDVVQEIRGKLERQTKIEGEEFATSRYSTLE